MSANNDITGQSANWFTDGNHLHVRFGLNLSDDEAKKKNEGASLAMLTGATIKTAPSRVFSNAVVVSAGAAVSIEVRSKAEVGFGFSLLTGQSSVRATGEGIPRETGSGDDRADDQPIARKLYAVGDADEQGYRSEIVRRFQGSGKLITVDLMRSHVTASQDAAALVSRWSCDIFTWNLRQYLDSVTSLVHNADNPRQPSASPAVAAAVRAVAFSKAFAVGAVGASAAAAAAAPVAVRAGVVWADGQSTQTFQAITVMDEDDPASQRIGFLHVNFFVRDAGGGGR